MQWVGMPPPLGGRFGIILLALLSVVLVMGGCGSRGGPGVAGKRPPPKVTVSKPLRKQIIEWDAYTGRFAAVDSVNIQARVSGYLESIHFTDGDTVKKGDLLFVVDPRPFKAALEQARGQESQARAKYWLARLQLARNKVLLDQKAISEEAYDELSSTALAAKGQVTTAKGVVADAQLNLDFTKVRSPFDGRVGRHLVSVGNLISGGSPNSTVLAIVESLDPIYFYFDVDERSYLRYLELARKGEGPGSKPPRNLVLAKLANEKKFEHKGRMDFMNILIDPGSATIRFRAVFHNPDFSLLPGLFAQVRVPALREDAILIPGEAIGRDQGIEFVYVVKKSGVVERRKIVTGPSACGLRIVRSGLGADDTLIINGLPRARPGQRVQPVQGKIALGSDECLAEKFPELFRQGSGKGSEASKGSRK
ncbi:MAG: efflux RND transporter periplasmic adaptor subunit [Deltaproteobacteria bacterium]